MVCYVCIFVGMIDLEHSEQPNILDQRSLNPISVRPPFVGSVTATPYHPEFHSYCWPPNTRCGAVLIILQLTP